MKRVRYILFYILFPLLLGFICYLFLRPEAFVVKMLFLYTGIWVSLTPEVVYNNLLLRFINNHFADFLWAFSMAHAMFAYGCFIKWGKWLLLIICVGTGIAMECLLGTFDIFDILMQWLAIGIVFYKYNTIKETWRKEDGREHKSE